MVIIINQTDAFINRNYLKYFQINKNLLPNKNIQPKKRLYKYSILILISINEVAVEYQN